MKIIGLPDFGDFENKMAAFHRTAQFSSDFLLFQDTCKT